MDDYELCVKLVTDKIPLEGHFGVTAATGGLSDDHDVMKFLTHSLVPFEEKKEEVGVSYSHTLPPLSQILPSLSLSKLIKLS